MAVVNRLRELGESSVPMGCAALIAVNGRGKCKSRLSTTLSDLQRLKLVRTMLSQVIEAAVGASTVRRVFVVSPENSWSYLRICPTCSPLTLIISCGSGDEPASR